MNNSLRRFCVLALMATIPVTAHSQDSTGKAPWLSTLSVGFPSFEGEMSLMLFTVGGNFTKIRPGTITPDFSIGTMPYVLAYGVIPVAARAGVALPMETKSGLLILPSAGLSAVVLAAGDDGASLLGRNFGIALASRKGSRFGVTWHQFEGETIMLLEIGVGRLR
jgi:hypothetical protein